MALCIVLLCGMPGAGKTLFAKRMKESIQKYDLTNFSSAQGDLTEEQKIKGKVPMTGTAAYKKYHRICLHYDSILPQKINFSDVSLNKSGTEAQISSWRKCRRDILHLVEKMLFKIVNRAKVEETHFRHLWSFKTLEGINLEGLDSEDLCRCFKEYYSDTCGHIIIVDDNMFYQSMRYEYYQLARKYATGFCQIYLKCSLETSYKRNFNRDASVTEETFKRMAKKFETPDSDKNSWEKNTIVVDSELFLSKSLLDNVVTKILDCCSHPVEPVPSENFKDKEASRQICLQSLLHQADNSLRKFVSQEIQRVKGLPTVDKKEVSRRAAHLNKTKKTFLELLKSSAEHQEKLRKLLKQATVEHPEEQAVQDNQEINQGRKSEAFVASGVQKKLHTHSDSMSEFELAIQELFRGFSNERSDCL